VGLEPEGELVARGPNPDTLSTADRDQLTRYERTCRGGSRHSARWDAASDCPSPLGTQGLRPASRHGRTVHEVTCNPATTAPTLSPGSNNPATSQAERGSGCRRNPLMHASARPSNALIGRATVSPPAVMIDQSIDARQVAAVVDDQLPGLNFVPIMLSPSTCRRGWSPAACGHGRAVLVRAPLDRNAPAACGLDGHARPQSGCSVRSGTSSP
jgi:hypothetical protein